MNRPHINPSGKLSVELLAVGPNAHGYGQLPDGRQFAFRVRNRKARLEIYRPDAPAAAPEPADVELVAERPLGRLNLDSQRSLRALLPALAVDAEPRQEPVERTLRAYLGRVDSVMDSWSVAPELGPPPRTLRTRLASLFPSAAA